MTSGRKENDLVKSLRRTSDFERCSAVVGHTVGFWALIPSEGLGTVHPVEQDGILGLLLSFKIQAGYVSNNTSNKSHS